MQTEPNPELCELKSTQVLLGLPTTEAGLRYLIPLVAHALVDVASSTQEADSDET